MDLSLLLLSFSVVTAIVALLFWLFRLLNELKRKRLLAKEQEILESQRAATPKQPKVVQIAGRDNHYIDNRGSKR